MTETHDAPGTPTDGGTVADPHDMSVVAGAHGSTDDHGGDHGHDDHGHAPAALGPIDWPMWAIGVAGLAVGVIVTAGFVVATNFSFSA